jgi:hypothetical protein
MINLHEKYAKKVQERFYQESLTESSFSKSLDMEFTGVRTVKVSSINTVPMTDYTRSGTSRYGTPTDLQDTLQEFVMTKDRAFSFIIDKGNHLEQNMITKAGSAISRELREVTTPEIDTYRFSKWAEGAGHKVTIDAPAKDNILELVIDAKMAMDNKLVPAKGRTLYVGSAAYKALLGCEEYIRLNDLGSKSLVNGKVGEIMGMDVKFVPDTYLPENVAFMIIFKEAAISPMKLHEYKVHKDPPGISGHLAEGRFIYDAFVIETKKDGIYVAKTA